MTFLLGGEWEGVFGGGGGSGCCRCGCGCGGLGCCGHFGFEGRGGLVFIFVWFSGGVWWIVVDCAVCNEGVRWGVVDFLVEG